MNMKYMKRIVLGVGVAGTSLIVFLTLLAIGSDFCEKNIFCGNILNFINDLVRDKLIYSLIFLSLPIFLFSLLTYRLHDSVFHAWFNFARWWVPVIIGVTLWVESLGSGSGMEGAIAGGLMMLFIGSFYLILILGSLSKIIHTYLTLKWKEKGKSTVLIDKVKNIFNILLYGSVGAFFLWLFM